MVSGTRVPAPPTITSSPLSSSFAIVLAGSHATPRPRRASAASPSLRLLSHSGSSRAPRAATIGARSFLENENSVYARNGTGPPAVATSRNRARRAKLAEATGTISSLDTGHSSSASRCATLATTAGSP